MTILHRSTGYQPYWSLPKTYVGKMDQNKTGFSPGDSSASNTIQSSSGSHEPPNKVRREVERLNQRSTFSAAPAVPVTWSEDKGLAAICDDERSLRSRRSAGSGSSSSAELHRKRLEKKRNLAEAELQLVEAEIKAAEVASRSGRSHGSRSRALGCARDRAQASVPEDASQRAPTQQAMVVRGSPPRGTISMHRAKMKRLFACRAPGIKRTEKRWGVCSQGQN